MTIADISPFILALMLGGWQHKMPVYPPWVSRIWLAYRKYKCQHTVMHERELSVLPKQRVYSEYLIKSTTCNITIFLKSYHMHSIQEVILCLDNIDMVHSKVYRMSACQDGFR